MSAILVFDRVAFLGALRMLGSRSWIVAGFLVGSRVCDSVDERDGNSRYERCGLNAFDKRDGGVVGNSL